MSGKYITVCLDDFEALILYLQENEEDIIIMLDEMSVSDIFDSLQKLKSHLNATILIFHSLPEVYHAATLLKKGIKGYENSYIAKENLLKMLKGVEDGFRWLFTDLTHFVINHYIKITDKSEPEFMPKLTQKEKDIALMIADGLTNKEIAQKENIALSTVKGHLRHIFEKAGVSDRISLALKFR